MKCLREILALKIIKIVYLSLLESSITYGIIGCDKVYENILTYKYSNLNYQEFVQKILEISDQKDVYEEFNVLSSTQVILP